MKCALKFLPSTEKCFADESIHDKIEIKKLSMLKNERLEFQMAYAMWETIYHLHELRLEIDSPIGDSITVCRVEQVPVGFAAYPHSDKKGYLRTTPGLYPDLLIPMSEQHRFVIPNSFLGTLFFTLECKDGLEAGDYPITVRAFEGVNLMAETTIQIHVIDAILPESDLIHTQWFHADCLAQYYDVPVFSKKHWEIIENFAKEAVESGINMILTPVVTPPLDTARGGERLTVQLVDISVDSGEYTFGYEKLDRWIDLMDKVGMKYFEICHLYTQWGVQNAPKVMATVDGEYKRIFGWDTDAHGEEYCTFIRKFLTSLVAHLKARGVDKRCYYHISDEPSLNHLEAYTHAKETIRDVLEGYPIIDAMSDYEFYKTGAVDNPIPATDHFHEFYEKEVANLWTYYCCSEHSKVSNRFIAMHGARTRMLGAQLFKYDVAGFLQWGYNFYNSKLSRYPINPFIDTCAEFSFPGGDSFSVYPGRGGKPYRSLHGCLFTEALTDLRAFKLCASLIGKEETLRLIEEDAETPITFFDYPISTEYSIGMREKINRAIENAIRE